MLMIKLCNGEFRGHPERVRAVENVNLANNFGNGER